MDLPFRQIAVSPAFIHSRSSDRPMEQALGVSCEARLNEVNQAQVRHEWPTPSCSRDTIHSHEQFSE
jgi:hypothetical protein